MGRWLLGIVVSALVGSGIAWAQDPVIAEPVANNPSGAYQSFKKVVDVLDPNYEQLYDFRGGEWFQGVSASVWRIQSKEFYLASLRVGYAIDQNVTEDDHKTVYGGVKLDVPGLVGRFAPQVVKDWTSGNVVGSVASVLGKYAAVGGFVGRDVSENITRYGVTVGGRITW